MDRDSTAASGAEVECSSEPEGASGQKLQGGQKRKDTAECEEREVQEQAADGDCPPRGRKRRQKQQPVAEQGELEEGELAEEGEKADKEEEDEAAEEEEGPATQEYTATQEYAGDEEPHRGQKRKQTEVEEGATEPPLRSRQLPGGEGELEEGATQEYTSSDQPPRGEQNAQTAEGKKLKQAEAAEEATQEDTQADGVKRGMKVASLQEEACGQTEEGEHGIEEGKEAAEEQTQEGEVADRAANKATQGGTSDEKEVVAEATQEDTWDDELLQERKQAEEKEADEQAAAQDSDEETLAQIGARHSKGQKGLKSSGQKAEGGPDADGGLAKECESPFLEPKPQRELTLASPARTEEGDEEGAVGGARPQLTLASPARSEVAEPEGEIQSPFESPGVSPFLDPPPNDGAAPRPGQVQSAAPLADAKPAESDDDWGMDWTAPKDAGQENLMERIRKQRDETASGWELEKWPEAPPSEQDGSKEQVVAKEPEPDDDQDWKGLFPHKEDLAEEEEDESYWFNDVEPDADWSLWPLNSKEGLAASVLVQKIRARAGRPKTPGGPFPSEEAGQLFLNLMSQQQEDQWVLVAALQWIEANVTQVKVVPPDLSDAAMMLLRTEGQTLRSIVRRLPQALLRTTAGSKIPPRETRKQSDSTVEDLTLVLHNQLPPDWGSKEELTAIVEEELGHVPCTLRVLALVHACEFTRLKNKNYQSPEALAVSFAKQRLPERAIEAVCRLTLERALDLANTVTSPECDDLRDEKVKVLERLQKEWRLDPSEEQLSQLHAWKLDKQLRTLLEVERDIEVFWHKTSTQVKDKAQQARQLAEFLNFGQLLTLYLREEGNKSRPPLGRESGIELTSMELASVRHSSSEVLQHLKNRYHWVPDLPTRKVISKTNWVARLSSLLKLASLPVCLHADEELKRSLKQDSHKQIGPEIMVHFSQWAKLQEGEGVVIKATTVMDKSEVEAMRKQYREYQPDLTKLPTDGGYLPMTPGALGNIQAMPMTPGFVPGTPGVRGPGTPARRQPPGTPAGPPPGTPGGIPPTPVGPSPGTPSAAFRVPPGTPAGPPPPTPFGVGTRPPGTPAGPPPPTPFGARPPGTPAGMPPMTPAGAPPMTPGALGPVPMSPGGLVTSRKTMVPMTPSGAFAAPMTPAGAVGAPGTPRERVPTTPKDPEAGFARIPATPAEALSGHAAAIARIPATPREALLAHTLIVPRTPVGAAMMAPFTPAAYVPMTPAAPGAAPSTPRGAAPFTPAGAAPFTPAGTAAAPFTPAGAGAAPSTPRGAAPFTPAAAGAAPFTPAGPSAAPFTPAGTGAAPFTPAASRGPATVGGAAPSTPRSPAPAPFTPAGPPPGAAAPFTPAGPPVPTTPRVA